MPAGRPTKYDPAFCDQVIELGRDGASKAEMAAELGVARSTFTLWENEHDEFSVAVKVANDLAQGWWEKKGRSAVFGEVPNFNATAFIFTMKNRFQDEWRDKVTNEHTGPNGGPVQVEKIERTIVDPKNKPSA